MPQDYGKAHEWWEKAALRGDAAAQSNLAVLYYEGQGVAQDYDKARAWFEKAAAQGIPQAQYNLGVLYSKGRGVPKDINRARAWFEKAATQTDDKEIQQAAQKALQKISQ